MRLLSSFLLIIVLSGCKITASSKLKSVTFKYKKVTGIGAERHVCRRDPSDVIKVGDKWYIWYTKLSRYHNGRLRPIYPEGYHGDIWYAVSEDEGHTWKEKGAALNRGKGAEWDAFGILTPNIIKADGKYYLYYTGVRKGFTNRTYKDADRTAIGVAVADSPDGP